MADNSSSENIGGIDVTVDADFSDLEGSLQSATDAAAAAAAEIGAAFSDAASGGTDQMAASLSGTSDAASAASTSLSDLFGVDVETAGSFEQLAGEGHQASQGMMDMVTAATEALQAIKAAGDASEEAGEHLHEAGEDAEEGASAVSEFSEQLTVFAETLAITEGLHEFAAEALETYGATQKAAISLSALTGSAQQANETIEQLKQLALSDALNFEQLVQADQRMTAFGIDTEKIPGLLQSAANAAAATGNAFDSVTQALIRVSASGQVSARLLVQLGLTTADLGKAMHTTADDVTAAFKALDQAARLDALTQAMSKFNGVAAAVAESIPGQWQDVKTQLEFVFEGIGEAMAPVATQLMGFIREDILPAMQSLVEGFNELPTPIKDGAVAAFALVAALVPLASGFAGLVLSVGAISASLPAVVAVWGTFTVGVAAVSPILVPLAAAVAALTAAVAASKVGIEAATGTNITWGESIKIVAAGIAGPMIGAEVAADVVTKELAKDQKQLSDIMADAAKKISAAAGATAAHQAALVADTSASNVAADSHLALSLKIGTEKEAVQQATAALDILVQKRSLGLATDAEVAAGLDALTAAQKTLTATQQAAIPVVDQLALKTAAFRNAIALLPPAFAQVATVSEQAYASIQAAGIALDADTVAAAGARQALTQLTAAYMAGAASAKQVEEAQAAVATAQEKVNKDLGEVPAWPLQAGPITATDQAISDLAIGLDKIPPFIPTLASVDAEWTKQSGHVNKLAKTDLPAAIAAYDQYISALEGVNAPLGQIYAAQEKLDQLQIDAASQAGTDATDQIIDLVNLQEQTEALATDAQGLGNVYKGLAKTFDDTFKDLGNSLTSVIVGTESVSKAFKEMGQKIASDIVSTLIDGSLAKLKAALVESMGGITSGNGGVMGSIAGLAGIGGKGGGGGAQLQAAAQQFQTSTASFSTATTSLTSAAATIKSAADTLQQAASDFSKSSDDFDESTGEFDDSSSEFDDSTDTSSGLFSSAADLFGGDTSAFGSATQEFGGFISQMGGLLGDLSGGFGGLLTLFGFQGGGEVPGNVLGLLHPQEMVLPAQYANVIRGLASSAGAPVQAGSFAGPSVGGTSNSIVQINLNNPQFHGMSASSVNDMMEAMVKAVRRAGARW